MIRYETTIDIASYRQMRRAVGWRDLDEEQATRCIENAAFLTVAYDGDRPVGMARVISDGGYIYLIVDVIVLPEYQGRGIGTQMIQQIEDWLQKEKGGRPTMMVYLMAAEGKEGFYKRFGFRERPDEDMGAGMSKWLEEEKS